MPEQKSYSENIKGLKPLAPKDVEALKEDAYIYLGRETCPYCREFADQFPDAGVPILYVDTQSTSVDHVLQTVREKYDVQTVPTFILRKKDGTFTKLNRDVRQTIKDFVSKQ